MLTIKLHKDLHPDAFDLLEPAAQFCGKVKITKHAREAAISDKYGKIPCCRDIDTAKATTVEIVAEIDDSDNVSIVKAVHRFKDEAGPGLDVVRVISSDGWLLTQWINESTDEHSSLRKEIYS